jgi:hypothetical protein
MAVNPNIMFCCGQLLFFNKVCLAINRPIFPTRQDDAVAAPHSFLSVFGFLLVDVSRHAWPSDWPSRPPPQENAVAAPDLRRFLLLLYVFGVFCVGFVSVLLSNN